jgi:hypothetical protein
MDISLTIYFIISIIVVIIATYIFTNSRANKKIKDYKTLDIAINEKSKEFENSKNELDNTLEVKIQAHENSVAELDNVIKIKIQEHEDSVIELDNAIKDKSKTFESLMAELDNVIEVKIKEQEAIEAKIILSTDVFTQIDIETKALQELKINGNSIQNKLESDTESLRKINEDIELNTLEVDESNSILHSLMSKIDLYSRINDFVDVGHYEMPTYLFETSLSFQEEIKLNRLLQQDLIKSKDAILCNDTEVNKELIDGQIKLMLTAFNIETDSLIAKVSPSNFPKILERIEKLANTLEKSVATLHCGFNLEYIKLKYDECKLQYQFTLKKKEEQEEQQLIREQIKEEQRAIKEFEKAISEAEKEEKLYSDLLDKARKELDLVSGEERLITQQRINDLELQLAEAQLKEERAKSMAEQTRKGHVYIISNIGSFGENVYKIGLTRRLDPMDRVKELGDASVPFRFDVHAMIYVDDAPTLERDLHKAFTHKRVNAVNLRKEFFNVDLESIKEAVQKIAGIDAEFNTTIIAEEYFETKRLINRNLNRPPIII